MKKIFHKFHCLITVAIINEACIKCKKNIFCLGYPPPAAQPCSWGEPVEDKILKGNTAIDQMLDATVDSCKAKCEDNAFCKSLSYHTGGNLCFLWASNDDENELASVPNYFYYKKGECEG